MADTPIQNESEVQKPEAPQEPRRSAGEGQERRPPRRSFGDRPDRGDRGDRGERGERGDRGDRDSGRGPQGAGRGGPRRRRFPRRKVCTFCVEKAEWIDYKDARKLRRFVTDRGKILPRRVTGTCARHQRILTMAIKRARHVALLPFKAE